MQWWETLGKVEFPQIYIIACLFLPLPDSNASQERTFSSATWMDGKLNNRQSDATFQMKVILEQNKAFLEETNVMVEEDSLKELAEISRALTKDAIEDRQKRFDIMDEERVRLAKAAAEEKEKGNIVEDVTVLSDTEEDDRIV